jgi:hypothetical protein
VSAIETLVTEGFELEAAASLGITMVPTYVGFNLYWQSALCGACATAVDSLEEAREWIRTNWRLFAVQS